MTDEPPPEAAMNIIIEPEQMAGVWANFAQVSHSEHEFQIDFVRMDTSRPGQGIVVARVAVSPLFVTQLIDALNDNWQKFFPKTMPPEVHDDGQADAPEDPGTGSDAA